MVNTIIRKRHQKGDALSLDYFVIFIATLKINLIHQHRRFTLIFGSKVTFSSYVEKDSQGIKTEGNSRYMFN